MNDWPNEARKPRTDLNIKRGPAIRVGRGRELPHEAEETDTHECTHHYILESLGATVLGVCKYCGAEREFSNSLPESGANFGATKPRSIHLHD